MANRNQIDKSYISEHDEFFHQFDKEHELSDSQKAEIKKHQRIHELRDNKQDNPPPKDHFDF